MSQRTKNRLVLAIALPSSLLGLSWERPVLFWAMAAIIVIVWVLDTDGQ